MTSGEDIGVRLEVAGGLGVVTLDRPQTLNALTLEMIRVLDPALVEWAEDPRIVAVVIRGAGDKAFCAGGDVMAIWHAGREGGSLAAEFFRAEYSLDHRIATFPKPFVALIDGITMGGGVGVSIHGRHRVASERTLFAMPETAIGLFPDVGASYFLPRLADGLGLYLGLTGRRLGGADCLWAGLATHYLPSDRHGALLEALRGAAADEVAPILEGFHETPDEPAPLAAEAPMIARHFRVDTVGEVMESLAADPDPWAVKTLATLERLSPTSLVMAAEALARGAGLDLAQCLVMEYRLSQACMAGHDYYEGVRALLVDKDKSPRWQPPSLAEVDQAALMAAFDRPAPDGDLVL